jgi:putative aldouronate transport system permease protein
MHHPVNRNGLKRKKNLQTCNGAADLFFYALDWFVLILLTILVLIPLLNVVSCSLSDPAKVGSGQVYLLPNGFSLQAYQKLFLYKPILTGFFNTIFYTIAGTALNIVMTIMCAYPLSRPQIIAKKYVMFYFTFTMLFGGGMIPTYLVIKDLNLLNTRWAMILPGAMGVYNMIVARTFFINTIPNELHEAAQIDGATDFQVLTRIVLPLSASIIAVLSLFYAVGHWNAFFSCYIYIDNPELWNLQVVLRNFIAYTKQLMESSGISDSIVEGQEAALMQDVLKYAIIVFTSLPIILLYPFVQKHFVKGVMIGSLKG